MTCQTLGCENEAVGYLWCRECAAEKVKEHKKNWRDRNKKYHHNYLKKWKREFKEKYGYCY